MEAGLTANAVLPLTQNYIESLTVQIDGSNQTGRSGTDDNNIPLANRHGLSPPLRASEDTYYEHK
jgi:hypothetical protein